MATYFLDPGLGTNTGSGTIGDPWGSTGSVLERAFDSVSPLIVQNAEPVIVNIKSGTADVLTERFDLDGFGPSTATLPTVFRGYDSVESDGGFAEIDCDGNQIDTLTHDGIHLANLIISNGPVSEVIDFDRSCFIFNCVIEGNIQTSFNSSVCYCSVISSSTTGAAINVPRYGICRGNWIYTSGQYGINATSGAMSISDNIVQMTSAANVSHGIRSTGVEGSAFNNSVILPGAGVGIQVDRCIGVFSNLIEGAATGVDFASDWNGIYANNSFYNCTAISDSELHHAVETGNETLLVSPFAKSGDNTYANRLLYFNPQDVGAVLNGSYQNSRRDRGAVQSASSGGGRSPIIGSSVIIGAA